MMPHNDFQHVWVYAGEVDRCRYCFVYRHLDGSNDGRFCLDALKAGHRTPNPAQPADTKKEAARKGGLFRGSRSAA